MGKDINYERMQLKKVIDELDERLGDFNNLLQKAIGTKADYSKESLAAVEKLLYEIKPDAEEDSELLIEASLYLGECCRIAWNGIWDIAEDDDNWGKPAVLSSGNSGNRLFPFDIVHDYLEAPRSGFFLECIENKGL